MRQLIVSIMFFTALLCAAVAQQSDSFMVYGQMRSFVMHVPSGLTTPPLLISMHGHGGTGSQQRSMTGFRNRARSDQNSASVI